MLSQMDLNLGGRFTQAIVKKRVIDQFVIELT
jgi:hypothetical protein